MSFWGDGIRKLFRLGKTSPKEEIQAQEKPLSGREKAIEEAREACSLNWNEQMRALYAEYLETKEIQENYILYESFGGRGMICSPYAIFRYLLEQEDFRSYVHIWVLEDFEDNQYQMERYKQYGNVRFILRQSPEYREYLAVSKYLINNVSFPGFFTKREGQVYVDTWHGIPLKTLGFDIPSGKITAGNTVKNFLAADYLIAPNAFMTEIYKKAFFMEGIFEGTILEVGQPRCDRTFCTDREEILEKLSAAGVQIDPGKKLILYAPTWKGSQYRSPDTSLDAYFELIHRVENSVDTTKYQILVKPHQIVYYHIKKSLGVTGQFIPATIDTNELLSVVDILISDYSSIYFDYLVTGRPVLFYIPDLEEYQSYRGLYFGVDKLPGPIAESGAELENLLRDTEGFAKSYREKYQKEAAWACPRDDGTVCARLVDTVFRGKPSQEAVRCFTNAKKKLLLYPGEAWREGCMFSLEELSHMLDYETYDVTVLVQGAEEEAQQAVGGLDDRLRILYRGQPANGTPEENGAFRYWMDSGEESVPQEYLRREIRRLFGAARFDCVVDLTEGRSLFSAMRPLMKASVSAAFSDRFVDFSRMQAEQKQLSELELSGVRYYIAGQTGEGQTVQELELLPVPDPEQKNYVAMGSFASQEEQELFLHAFEGHCQGQPVHLYWMGEENQAFADRIRGTELDGRITCAGFLPRPFGFMKLCDAFVCLPGQKKQALPVLEARALGLPVVRADFSAEECAPLDARQYNQEKYAAFERLLCQR